MSLGIVDIKVDREPIAACCSKVFVLVKPIDPNKSWKKKKAQVHVGYWRQIVRYVNMQNGDALPNLLLKKVMINSLTSRQNRNNQAYKNHSKGSTQIHLETKGEIWLNGAAQLHHGPKGYKNRSTAIAWGLTNWRPGHSP